VTATTAPLPFDQVASDSPSPARLAFEVPGEPQPQGSTKAFKHRHSGRVMVTSDNARLRPWRDAVSWHARQAQHGGGPLIGPVKVRVEFRFARPGGHFGKRGLRPAAPREHVV
jgi:Holliday junction resolvase RusA-like endonuclease